MENKNDVRKVSIDVSIDVNERAWNEESYVAWIEKFGQPSETAKKISKDPIKPLSILYPKLGDVKGKKVMNLMGSNGTKAVALALLGAEVSIVDFSEGNRHYALELAQEANVKINYILSNVFI